LNFFSLLFDIDFTQIIIDISGNEEMEIEVVERKKQIDVQEKEILRKEKELMSNVKLPAEAEAYRVEMIATGKRTQTVAVAQAEAQRIKLIGGSEVCIDQNFKKNNFLNISIINYRPMR
jgi:regulator of protease activity HflC (stomatin/prohibitin superfamily)